MSLAASYTTPATTITTTNETLAANVPAMPVYEGGPGGGLAGIVIRGVVYVTTGTAAAKLTVNLRVGQNNTSTNQVGTSNPVPCAASALFAVPFLFVDASAPVGGNLNNSGYSITVTQGSATGNGTVTAVTYEVDRAPV